MQIRLLPLTLQVVIEPFQQILRPIPTRHFSNGFAAVARILRVVFAPLVG